MPDSHSIDNIFTHALTEYLRGEGRDIVVAYSGGVDSHVLLHCLAGVREQFPQHSYSAIYIHHGLSSNADRWQYHCELVCKALNFEFRTAKVRVSKAARQSIEAEAREQRYTQLKAMVADNSFILLGQHLDDQLETYLLQLKRGAGPKGLSAMAKVQVSDRNIHFLRPFLDISRAQIMAYARAHDLRWQEDESNQNTQFDRNFLRQKVLPLITERWPEFAKSTARSAALCAEQQSLLDELARQKLEAILVDANCLNISRLIHESDAWQRQIIRYWLERQNIISPSHAIMKKIRDEVLEARDDANPILRWQNWQLRRFDNKLYVLPLYQELGDIELSLKVEHSLELPDGLGKLSLSLQALDHACVIKVADVEAGLTLRFGNFGSKFKPQDQAQSKPLKQWFKQWKIAPWQRQRTVQIYAQDSLIALLCEGRLIAAKSDENKSLTSLYLGFAEH